ncbi:hypothetical protein Leryth_024459 [Lithospermum erythrorhizon]|nr:hypothetical protein Leryth_024459 [Lithospermum erythrorhizon]
MVETPSPASSRNELQRKSHRYAAEEEDGDDDSVKCTGKACQSCTAGLIADCVAICCCPCAVVNILAFTFLKIPYMMGRKWLKKGRMKMRDNLERKRKCERIEHDSEMVVEGKDGNSRKRRVDHEGVMLQNDLVLEFGVEELRGNFSAKFEDVEEDVWLELYKIGHLGFGRVSFSGIPSHQGKSSN